MCTPPSAIEGGAEKFSVGLGVFKIVFREIDWQVGRGLNPRAGGDPQSLGQTHRLMGMTLKCGLGQWVQGFVTRTAWLSGTPYYDVEDLGEDHGAMADDGEMVD
ncbi:hypothetical protein PPACK8108_LOCUS7982 [Phakopsora pachyrhizi]|uniref:Uncharacterized protein n=1 Tax=Phakopsora pachyrhizi TaxID=170000 RepID=A0AAV0ATX2_PHAPC|nr:hypothetical protein PPACK8108_LOCUS7982 [Phakopsora pachyrhizi]